MFANPNLIYFDTFVFCSIPRLFVCLRMRMSTSKQCAKVYVKSFWSVRGPLRERRSIRSGASGLPYYCAPLVCVSDVIELLAVWRYNKPKTQKSKSWFLRQKKVLGANTHETQSHLERITACTVPAHVLQTKAFEEVVEGRGARVN